MLADRLLGLVLMAVSACIFGVTLAFPAQAAVYPLTVLAAIFLLSLGLCLFPASQKRVALRDAWTRIMATWHVPAMMAAIFAFIVCINPLGFYPALFLFAIVSQMIMGTKNAGRLFVISLLLTVAVYVIFSLGIQLNIPMGLLEF